MLPKPEQLEFKQWAAQVSQNYPESEVPAPPDESRWREWATSLLRRTPFNGVPVAHPDDFRSWRDWAERAALVLGIG
jgi:hypothetical protein